jgi:hypothetical protein
MGEYKVLLELVKGCVAFVIEVPRGILSCQTSEGSGDFGVAIDEPAVEIGKAKKGLNVFDFAWFRPIKDSLHFVFSHAESIRGKDISKVFHTVPVKFTFPSVGIQAMLPESAEDFFDMLFVLGHVVRVD